MRELNRKIDSFCLRHPRFGVPRLMLFIIIGNAVVWLFGMMDTTNTLYYMLRFDPALFCRGQIWRIVTFAFVPEAGSLVFLAISLYFYYFIGSALESAWGPGKFTIYYLSGMLVTALYSLIVWWIARVPLVVTPHWLNMSLFFAFATLWPDQRVLLLFVIPVKIKWLAWLDAAYFVYQIAVCFAAGLVWQAFLPVVAMLTYIVFCGGWLIDIFRPGRVKQRANTVRFKSAARKAQQARASRPFTHQCAVCGRTNVSDPSLEFRYCSRCAGYHCFCADHINNHVHFTE